MDVFDMARLRLPVAVRRPSSRNPPGPSNLQRIHDSLQLRASGKAETSGSTAVLRGSSEWRGRCGDSSPDAQGAAGVLTSAGPNRPLLQQHFVFCVCVCV